MFLGYTTKLTKNMINHPQIKIIVPLSILTLSLHQAFAESTDEFSLSNHNSTKFWPDFSCVQGWYDVSNRDASHPLAAARGAGVKLMWQVNTLCDKIFGGNRTKDGPSRCQKECILKGLVLIRRVDNSSKVSMAELGTFRNAIRLILTDKGGFNSVVRFSESVYPTLNESSIWKELSDKSCEEPVWDELFNAIDDQILQQSSETCLSLRKEAENSKEEYLKNNHMIYTANLDFSCYDDFVYRGIDSGEGDMVPFMQITNECNELLLSKGIKSRCQSVCMFHKMGIFRWIDISDFSNDTDPEVFVWENEMMVEHFKRFFSGPNTFDSFITKATEIQRECEDILVEEVNRGCTKMTLFEDCVERILSCNYTGKFLRNNSFPAGKTVWEKSETDLYELSVYYGFPSMACRQGYLRTTDFRKGSGLLKRYNTTCGALVRFGYYDCDKLCILEQMGIIMTNSTVYDGAEYQSTFTFSDEQEMTFRLNQVLTEFGGWDSAFQIASTIVRECTEILDKLGVADCDSPEWRDLLSCLTKAMSCKASALFYVPEKTTNDVVGE